MGMKFDVNDNYISDLLDKLETRANTLIKIVTVLRNDGTIYDEDTERIKRQVLALMKDSDSLILLCVLKGIIEG